MSALKRTQIQLDRLYDSVRGTHGGWFLTLVPTDTRAENSHLPLLSHKRSLLYGEAIQIIDSALKIFQIRFYLKTLEKLAIFNVH